MATIELNKTNLNDTIQNEDIVIIDFWAPWCGPCKSFAPIYEEMSDKQEGIVFGKVNTEEEQEIAGQFQIRSIPTLTIFREQIIVFSQPGMMPASALEEIISKVRELDIDRVREELTEQSASN